MKQYARVADGRIAELFSTDGDITRLFHASLRWVEVTGTAVAVGWVEKGAGFVAPALVPASLVVPTVAELQAELATLSARIAALSSHP
ncbi:MAG: hypothetical protein KGJ41_02705 [Rhodospirillales bacterium]|nr:hypothetical protein [Rhodospirillales bacterium]